MTLDEAIKNEEEIAIQQIEKANALDNIPLFGMSEDDIEEIKECYKCSKEHEQLAEWLKELKQLRKQTRWIPVSEKLPNYAGTYLVTRYFPNNVMNPTYLVDACFFDGTDTWHNDNRINHERKYLTNVVAWLEEPEPYKASPTGEVTKND